MRRIATAVRDNHKKKGRLTQDTYFLLLFFWFAAIFSFAVNGAGFELTAPATVPVAVFVSSLSGFFPLPFWLPLSLMKDHAVRKMIYIGCKILF